MNKILLISLLLLPFFAHAMCDETHVITPDKKLLCANTTTQVWLEISPERKHYQLVKKRIGEEISFIIPYHLPNSPIASANNLFLSNDSRYVLITRENRAVIFLLSTKTHQEFIQKKNRLPEKKKPFDAPYGVLKNIREIEFSKPITEVLFLSNNKAAIMEGDDNLSIIDLEQLN